MPHPDEENGNRHGTRCAGEIAAVSNNSFCAVGVAFGSRIAGAAPSWPLQGRNGALGVLLNEGAKGRSGRVTSVAARRGAAVGRVLWDDRRGYEVTCVGFSE